MCYLSSFKIYADSFTFKLEYLNESIFLITCYHFLFFTNILGKDDPYTPEYIGKSLIISMVLLLAITAIVMVSMSCKAMFLKLKAKKNQKKKLQIIKDYKVKEPSQIGLSVPNELFSQDLSLLDHRTEERKQALEINFVKEADKESDKADVADESKKN